MALSAMLEGPWESREDLGNLRILEDILGRSWELGGNFFIKFNILIKFIHAMIFGQ